MANKIVVDNMLVGGGYSIYGGGARNDRTSNIVIENNEFGQLYYPQGGKYGPVAYFNPTGNGERLVGERLGGTSGRGPDCPARLPCFQARGRAAPWSSASAAPSPCLQRLPGRPPSCPTSRS